MTAPLIIVREDGSAWAFDAVPPVSRDRQVRVTEHPLEAGGTVSDHAQALPESLTVPAVVAQVPLAGRAYGQPTGQARLDAADDFLTTCVGQRLDLQFPTFTLSDYALTAYPVELGGSRMRAYRLVFRQLRIPTASTVSIPASQPPATEQSGIPDENDVGEQTGESVESDEVEEDSSVLYGLLYGDEEEV